MATQTSHYTMLSLGYVSATLPDGQSVRHPLNFGFSGSAAALRKDKERQQDIDELVAENALQFSQHLFARGAQSVECDIRPVAQVL